MTTETTNERSEFFDPLERAVMEAVSDFALTYAAKVVNRDSDLDVITERLRLHVRLALAKARYDVWKKTVTVSHPSPEWLHEQFVKERDEIAALEAQVQEE